MREAVELQAPKASLNPCHIIVYSIRNLIIFSLRYLQTVNERLCKTVCRNVLIVGVKFVTLLSRSALWICGARRLQCFCLRFGQEKSCEKLWSFKPQRRR